MTRDEFPERVSASERIRIPFHDVDPANIAWHGRYFKYFEGARCLLLEDLSYSYQEMIESDLLWPVVDASVRYLRPLLLRQEVEVTAILQEWEMRIVVDYRIRDSDGSVCTRGQTVQVPVNAKTQELTVGAPDAFIKNVERRIAMLSGPESRCD